VQIPPRLGSGRNHEHGLSPAHDHGTFPHHALEVIASNCSLPYLAIVKVIIDCFGHSVRLTDERLAHILEHPEMAGMEDELERVLQTPSEVRLSRSDDNVRLFYEFYTRTRMGGKWLCVVVKYLPDDAFVITAYLTDTLKAGETVWPKR
jgi:hypothetical protein